MQVFFVDICKFFSIYTSAYQPNRFHTAVKIRRSDFWYKVYKCHKSVDYCTLIKTIEDYSFRAFVNRTNISIATVAVPIWKLDFISLKVWKKRFVIGQTVIIMIINGARVDMIIISDLGWRTWTAYLHSGCAQCQGLSLWTNSHRLSSTLAWIFSLSLLPYMFFLLEGVQKKAIFFSSLDSFWYFGYVPKLSKKV